MSAFTREDMVDAIATAISDSMDVDWNSHTGAEAVVRNCGVFELYEALEWCVSHDGECLGDNVTKLLNAQRALAKVRGGQ